MTPVYIYEFMTWEEIAECLQFANRYEEVKIPHYKNKVAFVDWIMPSVKRSMDGLRRIAKKLKEGK
jgi:hypothetical protein